MRKHVKVYPGLNDALQIQHADDLIDDGTEISGEPHEVAGYPIGHSIESYQGALTVEVFQYDRFEDSWVNGRLIYPERLIEQLKVIDFWGHVDSPVRLVFRLRSDWGSVHYDEAEQFVVVANHEHVAPLETTTSPATTAPATTAPGG